MMWGMRWADLVLAYLRVMIWPVVILILFLVFRRQVRKLLELLAGRVKDISSMRGFGVEFELAQQDTLDARKAVDGMAQASKPDFDSGSTEFESVVPQAWTTSVEDLADRAQESPQTTIVAAWQQLDAAIRMLYRNLNPDTSASPGVVDQVAKVAATLHQQGVIDNSVVHAVLTTVMKLASSRDSVEKRYVTKLEAYDYASSATQIARTLLDAYSRLSRPAAVSGNRH
jgi:hypothetical protein